MQMKILKTLWLLHCIMFMLGSMPSALAQSFSSTNDANTDITEESFWTGNDVALVRVKAFRLNERLQAKITADIVLPITGNPLTTLQKADVFDNYGYLDWDREADRKGIILQPDEMLAVYRSNTPNSYNTIPARTYITRLKQELNSDLAKTLIAIRQIRRDGNNPKTLMEGIFDNNHLVASYCTKQILSKPVSQLPHDSVFIGRLLALRNDESADIRLRILVSHLVNLIKAGNVLGGDEYEWGKMAVTSSHQLDFYQLNDLVTEIASFPDKRRETVEFLISMLQNPNVRKDIRDVAYGNIYDQPLFDVSHLDDPVNQTIIVAYISQLKDKDPMFRLAAADGLSALCNRFLASAGADVMTRRAKDAIKDASKVETDRMVVARMQIILVRMNDSRFYAQ